LRAVGLGSRHGRLRAVRDAHRCLRRPLRLDRHAARGTAVGLPHQPGVRGRRGAGCRVRAPAPARARHRCDRSRADAGARREPRPLDRSPTRRRHRGVTPHPRRRPPERGDRRLARDHAPRNPLEAACPARWADVMSEPLPNPVTRYRTESFPRQEQEQPGLTSLTDPTPDHGEESYRGSGRLTGMRALITGGDSGIGRAVAIAYAREGADVAISYLPEEEDDARDTAEWIEKAGRVAVRMPGDVRSEDQCAQLVERTVSELGGLDILVLNAGYQENRDGLENIPTSEIERVFDTNLFAPMWIARAAIPHLK